MEKKKVVYIDMDGVLCDFWSAVSSHPDRKKYSKSTVDMIPGIYNDLNPMPGAIEAFEKLFQDYSTYKKILD